MKCECKSGVHNERVCKSGVHYLMNVTVKVVYVMNVTKSGVHYNLYDECDCNVKVLCQS